MKRTCIVWIVASVFALTVFLHIPLTDSYRFFLHSLDLSISNTTLTISISIDFSILYYFQIRRYVYHDVVRMDDAAKLIDCSYIQSYKTNSAKVVFLNQRPQTKKCSSGNICSTCDRSLQEPYNFCSLSCKVIHLVKTLGTLSGYLFECNYMPLSDSGLDDGLMTPDSVLEPAGSNRTSSGSGGYGGVDCRTTLACTATTEIVRKKRSGCSTFRPPCRPACSPVTEIAVNLMNRRKGNPQRAPLY
ncbi:hypothetical protein KIW84_034996 [Lathyrus oleraceus]|uniref:PLATZ transcription factor family protein n=1 Tax=Pisum sativum TaxID=3888 RepID=A0A9D4Y1R1_PEA|nr:hypothetical protein KIW84_034996 [Pisum sativum]